MRRAEDPRVRDGEARFLERPLELASGASWPSFYFPVPLWCQGQPEPALEDMPAVSTVVVVPLDPAVVAGVASSLAELAEAHVHFVGLRPSKSAVKVIIADGEQRFEGRTSLGAADDRLTVMARWAESDAPPSNGDSLATLAQAAAHAVSQPGVAVGWPRIASAAGHYFCYLPTLVIQPFGVDVHADFQLKIDRTALRTDERERDGVATRAGWRRLHRAG